jgi:hypothetical protein
MKIHLLAASVALMLVASGCNKPSEPVSEQDRIAKNSRVIEKGTASVVSIGLLAVPNPDEADLIAKEAARVLDENVLPLLAGDEQGLVAGLQRLLDLSVFDGNPQLSKIKLILEMGLPLLDEYLPPNLADNATSKLPADAKAYLNAFFKGARKGLADYLGDPERGLKRAKNVDFDELRKKLSS